MYQITYRADRWQAVQHRNPTAGAWQIAHQDLPDHQRLSVEIHRTSDGSVSITDARIEYALIGRTGKPHWHTRRTLHPDEVLLEEIRFATQ